MLLCLGFVKETYNVASLFKSLVIANTDRMPQNVKATPKKNKKQNSSLTDSFKVLPLHKI